QMREHRPSWVRTLPLLTGVGAMLLATSDMENGILPVEVASLLFVLSFAVICVGIVLIGPWLTYHGARLVSRFASTAESVIASSRIRATPASTFRSVSGLVVAVFMVSVF